MQDLLAVMLIAAFFIVLVVADLAQPSDSPAYSEPRTYYMLRNFPTPCSLGPPLIRDLRVR